MLQLLYGYVMAAATAAVPARREETRLQFLRLLKSASAPQLPPCLPWAQPTVQAVQKARQLAL